MPDQPRPFQLHRRDDVTGVSGTGVVAEGVVFGDGSAALRWLTEWPTSVVWHDRGVESIEHVHGHGGATQIVWLDRPPAQAPAPAPPADPGLRDAIINAIGPHTEACQDTACRWCDDAARRADAVLEVVAEYLGTPLADLARRMRQRAREGDGGADARALGEFADELAREVARPVAAMGGD